MLVRRAFGTLALGAIAAVVGLRCSSSDDGSSTKPPSSSSARTVSRVSSARPVAFAGGLRVRVSTVNLARDAAAYAVDAKTSRARNPQQQLALSFEGSSVSVSSTSKASPWHLDLALRRWGRAGRLALAAKPAAHQIDGDRVTYPRGDVSEWYVNARRGLEQGFTIARRPAPAKASAQIELHLAIGGDLTPRLSDDGKHVLLRDRAGRVAARYGELFAFDARRRALPSRLAVADGRIVIHVDDACARYPVTVDPLLTTVATDSPPPLASARMGSSADIDGNTAVVGSVRGALVFVNASGSWSLQQRLPVTNVTGVAISGDTIAVALGEITLVRQAGAVQIFTRSGTTWSLQQQLNGISGDRFAASVDVAGDWLIIGAPGVGSNGAAFVRQRVGTVWQTRTTLSPSVSNTTFGAAVAVASSIGTRFVVGAPGDGAQANNAGAAYVYVRSGTTYTPTKLTASDASAGYLFGSAAAADGDYLVIGAPNTSTCSNCSGKAYQHSWSGSTYVERAVLQAPIPAAYGDEFGATVAIDGRSVAVGAPGAFFLQGGQPPVYEVGEAYVFYRSGAATSYSFQARLQPGNESAVDRLGSAVAISDQGTLIAGVPNDDIEANDSGSAVVFARDGSLTWNVATVLDHGSATRDFGFSVAVRLRLQATTLLVGAPGDYHNVGSATHIFDSSLQTVVTEVAAGGRNFGRSVAIGGFGNYAVSSSQGGVTVYRNDHTVLQRIAASASTLAAMSGDTLALVEGAQLRVYTQANASAQFVQQGGALAVTTPTALAIGGDTIAVAQWGGLQVPCRESVAVYRRAAGQWSLERTFANTSCGGGIGVDGDTVAVTVGSGVRVLQRSSAGTWSQAQLLQPSQGAGSFGRAIAVLDKSVAVGAPGFNADRGAVFVFIDGAQGWSERALISPATLQAGDAFGSALAFGNIRNLVVGAPGSSGGGKLYRYTFNLVEDGQACNSGNDQCISGNCVLGICCGTQCADLCKSCATGVCLDIPSGATDTTGSETCSGDKRCDGSGACLLVDGKACVQGNNECLSGFCVDGYCCDTACNNTCETCDLSGSEGTCSPIIADSDVGCGDTDPCESCVSGTCTPKTEGDEITAGSLTCTGKMACNGKGSCALKQSEQCSNDADCVSGHCIDGYCCDTACTGNCQRCDLPNLEGTCSSTPKGEDPDNDCPGTDSECRGTCDGAGKCDYPKIGKLCGLCKACDGTGRCTETPSDDSNCGVVIDCNALDNTCRDYHPLDSERCATFGKCKIANDPATCSKFTTLPGCEGQEDGGPSSDARPSSDGAGPDKCDDGSDPPCSGCCAVAPEANSTLPGALLIVALLLGLRRRGRRRRRG